MKEKRIVLSPEAQSALSKCGLDTANFLRLPSEQLPRAVYVEVKTALESIGGKWDTRRQGFVFDRDPEFAIAQAMETGAMVNRRQTLQEFFTPEPLAAEMAKIILEHRNTETGSARPEVHSVLEPSAGQGALVNALLAAAAQRERNLTITALEIQEGNAFKISPSTFPNSTVCPTVCDFTKWSPNVKFDAVCMNPPFANGEWPKHVNRALKFLKPGGILVSVVPASALEEHCTDLCVLLPVNAKFAHTNISTKLLVVIKGCCSKAEILLAALMGNASRKPGMLAKPAPEPEALKSPEFYLAEIRKGLKESLDALGELEAMLKH